MNQKEPVILVVSQLPPPVHGSTVMTKRFMDALRSAGYDAKIVEKNFSRRIEDVGGYSVRKVLEIFPLCLRLEKALKEERPTLCIFFTTVGLRSFIIDSLLVSILKMSKIPFVHYFHGKGYLKLSRSRIPCINSLLKYTLGSAIGGLVLGKRLMADVDRFIPGEHLYVLPNGVPDEIGEKQIPSKKQNDKKTVVFLSNLIRTKGPMEFIQAANLVLKKTKDVTFVLAGGTRDNMFLEEITKYIRMHNLKYFIKVPGPLYGKDKAQLLRGADVFLLPTKYENEISPLVNLEAMQYAVPIISTDEGAIPEVVRDGINGYIVKADDVEQISELIIELLRDDARRISMGRMGRKIYKDEYSIEAYEKNVRVAMEYFLGKIKLH